jgi:hypothetical protein
LSARSRRGQPVRVTDRRLQLIYPNCQIGTQVITADRCSRCRGDVACRLKDIRKDLHKLMFRGKCALSFPSRKLIQGRRDTSWVSSNPRIAIAWLLLAVALAGILQEGVEMEAERLAVLKRGTSVWLSAQDHW